VSPIDLTAAIKDQAHALGFDLVGIAPATPSTHGEAYADWVAQGYAGEMAYLSHPEAVAKRRDPRLVLPTVRSVVVVGMNYYTEVPQRKLGNGEIRQWGPVSPASQPDFPVSPASQPSFPVSQLPLPAPTGLISRYAWGLGALSGGSCTPLTGGRGGLLSLWRSATPPSQPVQECNSWTNDDFSDTLSGGIRGLRFSSFRRTGTNKERRSAGKTAAAAFPDEGCWVVPAT